MTDGWRKQLKHLLHNSILSRDDNSLLLPVDSIMQSVTRMKSLQQVLICFAIFFALIQINSSEILQISDGTIDGKVLFNRLNQPFHAFLGIPFAEAPVDELRFTDPVVKAPWVGALDCTSYGPRCMQRDIWDGLVPIKEDCLFLNVFTKNLPIVANTELKPVIAYLHGGGFETGSSIESEPEYLMERDVLLVTIQYRLGAFGFLAVGTKDIPGNAGYKDQVLALKWIQNNIKSFGGDPDRVTIAGHSAGAHAVTAHMISPMSQRLFKNVIAASGALPWQRKLKSDNADNVKLMASRLNCPDNSTDDMINCLRNKPAADIASNMNFPYLNCPMLPWQPVIEEDFGHTRFLTDQPETFFKEGNFARVNVMAGVSVDEFTSPVVGILNSPEMTAVLNENFYDFGSRCFRVESDDSETVEKYLKALREAYLPFDKIDVRHFDNLAKLLSDGTIRYGVHKFVHYASAYVDVYYYKFSYVGRFSHFMFPRDKPYGVHHVDDIQYVFGSSYMGSKIKLTDPENIAVERMTRIWEQFASNGDPNNSTDEYLRDMNWPKLENTSEFYLDIGTHLVEKNGLFLERFSVWDNFDKESSGFMLKANFVIVVMLLGFLMRNWL